MRFKYPEYNEKFILELEDAGFKHLSHRIGPLESRAHFMFEEGAIRIPLLVKYCATLDDIKKSKHQMGALLESGRREFVSVSFFGVLIRARK